MTLQQVLYFPSKIIFKWCKNYLTKKKNVGNLLETTNARKKTKVLLSIQCNGLYDKINIFSTSKYKILTELLLFSEGKMPAAELAIV